MKTEIRETIKSICKRAVSAKINLPWPSSEVAGRTGERRSLYAGGGDDFDYHDVYTPGEDDVRDIDWNAVTTGPLLVRKYRETRDIKSFVMSDVSPSMDFGTARTTKRVLAAELAACCVNSIDTTKDRVGSIPFSAKNVETRNITTGLAANMLLPILAGILETNQSQNGPGNGLARALNRLPTSRSLVFLISDFLNFSDDDWSALSRAAKRHDVMVFYVQDRRERELPASTGGWFGWLDWFGWLYTFQDWTGDRRSIWVNKKTRAAWAAQFRQHQATILARLENAHCRPLVVSTEEGDSAFPKVYRALANNRY